MQNATTVDKYFAKKYCYIPNYTDLKGASTLKVRKVERTGWNQQNAFTGMSL